MRLMISLAVASALTGCATGSYWHYPPGGTEAQWHRDVYECTQEAQQGSSSAYVNPYGGAAQSGTTTNYELRNACMRARGYRERTQAAQPTQAAGQSAWKAPSRNDFMTQCNREYAMQVPATAKAPRTAEEVCGCMYTGFSRFQRPTSSSEIEGIMEACGLRKPNS